MDNRSESEKERRPMPGRGVYASLYAASVLLLVFGVLLTGFSLLGFDAVSRYVSGVARDATLFTPALFGGIMRRARLAGVILTVAAVFLIMARAQWQAWIGEVLASWPAFRSDLSAGLRHGFQASPAWTVALLLLVCLAVGVRLEFLFQPMTCDEAYTFNRYASKPLFFAMSNYSGSNNHPLNTLLIHIASVCFGSDPWVVRLPAVIAGIGMVPVAFLLARRLFGLHAALLTAGMVATSWALIEYSIAGRGYSIQTLIFLLTFLMAAFLLRRNNLCGWIAFGLLIALGFFTIPTYVLAYASVLLWLFFSRLAMGQRPWCAEWRRNLFASLTVTAVTTALLYLPKFIGTGMTVLNDQTDATMPPTLAGLVHGLAAIGKEVWRQWHRHTGTGVQLLMAAGLGAAILWHKRIGRVGGSPAIAILLGCLPILVITRIVPYPRVWLFALPLYLALVAAGLVFMAERISRLRVLLKPLVFAVLVVGASGFQGYRLVRDQALYCVDELWPFPDAVAVSSFLQRDLQPGDRVYSLSAMSILEYYLKQGGQTDLNDYLYGDYRKARRFIVVVITPMQTLDWVMCNFRRHWPDIPTPAQLTMLRRFPRTEVYEWFPPDRGTNDTTRRSQQADE